MNIYNCHLLECLIDMLFVADWSIINLSSYLWAMNSEAKELVFGFLPASLTGSLSVLYYRGKNLQLVN